MRLVHLPILSVLAATPSHADPLQPTNNLRVALQCAEYLVTPDHGMRVTIDGVAAGQPTINGTYDISYNKYGAEEDKWRATSVGFDVSPGAHHVTVDAPDCAGDAREVTVAAAGTMIGGRLEITNPSLLGTAGSPNGWGFTLGGFSGAQPADFGNDGRRPPNDTTYSTLAAATSGLFFSASFERRHLVVAFDWKLGGGSTTGTTQQFGSNPSGPVPYTQSVLQLSGAARIGARLPLRMVDLAAGSGVGVDLGLQTTALVNPMGPALDTPGGAAGSVYLPLWAAVTFKATCSLGVQALASYDVRPSDTSGDNFELAAGLIWQPSNGCSEPAGVEVR